MRFFFFENYTLRGVNSGVTQFTHNLHMFIDRVQNEKNSLGKTVMKMWSQICGKIAMLVHKVTLKKRKKVKNT